MMNFYQTSLFYKVFFKLFEQLLYVLFVATDAGELVQDIHDAGLEHGDVHELGWLRDVAHVGCLQLRPCLRHSRVVNIDFSKVKLSLLEQSLGTHVSLSNDADLQPFRLRELITYNCLKYISWCDPNMYRQLKLLISYIRDCIHTGKVGVVLFLSYSSLGCKVLWTLDLRGFVLAVISRRLIIYIR